MKQPVLLAAILLLTAKTTGNAQQSNPNGVIPLNTTNQPYLFLVRDPQVHADLELTPSQLKRLTALNDQIDMPLWSMRNKTPQHVVKTMEESTSRTKQALATILSSEQNQRIAQIELWVLGLKSLVRNDIATKVELSDDQRSEVREILVKAQQKMNSLQSQLNDGGDAVELNKQYRETQTNQQKMIVAALSSEQQNKYRALLGSSIDTSKLGRIKFKAPELHSGSGWVNSSPLTMEKLKGKVVALHFYAFA